MERKNTINCNLKAMFVRSKSTGCEQLAEMQKLVLESGLGGDRNLRLKLSPGLAFINMRCQIASKFDTQGRVFVADDDPGSNLVSSSNLYIIIPNIY